MSQFRSQWASFCRSDGGERAGDSNDSGTLFVCLVAVAPSGTFASPGSSTWDAFRLR
jgi:hypothetical protein